MEDLKRTVETLELQYERLVTAGDTTKAMDVFHDKLTPARLKLVEKIHTDFKQTQDNLKHTSSKFNTELFHEAMSVISDSADTKPSTTHYGKVDVGAFINYLEENYTMERK